MAGTVAIDLGSSTTVVAYQPPDGEARLVALPPYSLEAPTVVPTLLWLASAESSRPLLGRQVLEADLAHGDSPSLQRDFKRLIGRNTTTSAADQASPWQLPLTPEQAGALLLRRLWAALPPELEPERLVLTAPIDTYQGYRRWLQGLADELAVAEVALVDEPTAAAIGCGLAPGSVVLVVDLGGGTCDLSLVQLQGGEGRSTPIAQLLRLGGRNLEASRQQLRCARVLGKAGLAVGGRDIDRWIAGVVAPGRPLSGSLLAQAEQLKCQLSTVKAARSVWSTGTGDSLALQLSATDLAELLKRQGLIAQLDALLESVLSQGRQSGVEIGQITAVLAVGGSSRLAPVQQWLQQRFAGLTIHNQRPVEAVALGALALTPGVRVRDVLSRGVALRCWERRSGTHQWHPLFVPGQSWPTAQPLELLLGCSRDGQTALEVVLGEPSDELRAEVVFDAGMPRLLQRAAGAAAVIPWSRQPFPIVLAPPGQVGVDRMRLLFSIDGACQLQLEAHDLLQPDNPPIRQQLGPLR
ncbi:MAG: Hsp70 family protein [Cyanobacteria bacterium REEB417]|nr:Hsp70 family protein [Cyanobacteria bacterium REEB417]